MRIWPAIKAYFYDTAMRTHWLILVVGFIPSALLTLEAGRQLRVGFLFLRLAHIEDRLTAPGETSYATEELWALLETLKLFACFGAAFAFLGILLYIRGREYLRKRRAQRASSSIKSDKDPQR